MATAVHANVMMGRHPMAAVPPHAHTQPHAHQGTNTITTSVYMCYSTISLSQQQLLPNHTMLCYRLIRFVRIKSTINS